MDIKQLEAFCALSANLHFAKAAEAIHVTPPALTRSIQRLEQDLGVELFYRNNRKVELTQAGIRFQIFAEETISQLLELRAELNAQSQAVKGELRVFASVTASYSVLSLLLPAFQQEFPLVEIKLVTGDQAEAIKQVEEGEVELAIAAKPDVMPNSLAFKTLSYSPLRFIMPASGAIAQQVFQALREGKLKPGEFPIIMPDKGLTRKRLEKWFQEQNSKAQVYATVSGHEAIVSMVALGLGIGVVPELVIEHSPMREQIRVIDGAPELKPFQIGLCALERQLALPSLKAFWDNAR